MNPKELLAAEYVLGTLEQAERERVERDRLSDAELEAMIRAWEDRLSPMLEEVEPLQPGELVFGKIEERLDAVIDSSRDSLHQQLKNWKAAAYSGFALAASLLLVIGALITQVPEPSHEAPFVAVFQQDDQQPAFLMTVDLETRTLKVQPLTAKGLSGQTYQLWIKADPLGPAPKSLGLLPTIENPTFKKLEEYDPELLKSALFGISVEPEGGSPTGKPTGPAIHGQLYPTGV